MKPFNLLHSDCSVSLLFRLYFCFLVFLFCCFSLVVFASFVNVISLRSAFQFCGYHQVYVKKGFIYIQYSLSFRLYVIFTHLFNFSSFPFLFLLSQIIPFYTVCSFTNCRSFFFKAFMLNDLTFMLNYLEFNSLF